MAGEGSRGGNIVRHTKSGAPVYGGHRNRVTKALAVGAGAAAVTGLGYKIAASKTRERAQHFLDLSRKKAGVAFVARRMAPESNYHELGRLAKLSVTSQWNSDKSGKIAHGLAEKGAGMARKGSGLFKLAAGLGIGAVAAGIYARRKHGEGR